MKNVVIDEDSYIDELLLTIKHNSNLIQEMLHLYFILTHIDLSYFKPILNFVINSRNKNESTI